MPPSCTPPPSHARPPPPCIHQLPPPASRTPSPSSCPPCSSSALPSPSLLRTCSHTHRAAATSPHGRPPGAPSCATPTQLPFPMAPTSTGLRQHRVCLREEAPILSVPAGVHHLHHAHRGTRRPRTRSTTNICQNHELVRRITEHIPLRCTSASVCVQFFCTPCLLWPSHTIRYDKAATMAYFRNINQDNNFVY